MKRLIEVGRLHFGDRGIGDAWVTVLAGKLPASGPATTISAPASINRNLGYHNSKSS